MGFIKEFREFAVRGNVVDMAVGIIIGAAFGKIVSSFVADVMMPPLAFVTGGADFTDKKLILRDAVMEGEKVIAPAVTMNYGTFITVTIDFILVAFAVFLLIKGINAMKRKQEAAPPPGPTKDQQLLMEIRDLLQSKS